MSHPNLEFTNPTTPTAPPKKVKAKQIDNFQWPVYGYTQSRTRDFDGAADLKPPLHVGWTYNDGALLEFPPVIYHDVMFLIDDDASAKAINVKTGKVIWQRKLGDTGSRLAGRRRQAGRGADADAVEPRAFAGIRWSFFALSMKTGKIIWRRPVGAGSETSPIVSGRTVYYGDGAGNLYARDVINGHLDWAYHASGAIKGGPALVGGVLYFGDYAGRAYAVRASNGHQVWATSTDGAHFGFGSGQFYTTPAVAYGRVYMGNTDGFVYSFGAANGKLAWATHTGGYVYASAAVADPKGVGPTVYVGSYDEHFYAFNARSGAVRWKHLARRADLRVGDGHRQRRLLRQSGDQDDDRTERCDRSSRCSLQGRCVHTGDRRLSRDLSGRLRRDLSDAAGRAKAQAPRRRQFTDPSKHKPRHRAKPQHQAKRKHARPSTRPSHDQSTRQKSSPRTHHQHGHVAPRITPSIACTSDRARARSGPRSPRNTDRACYRSARLGRYALS